MKITNFPKLSRFLLSAVATYYVHKKLYFILKLMFFGLYFFNSSQLNTSFCRGREGMV